MSALSLAFMQMIVVTIAFFVAFAFNKSGLKWWRVVAGCVSGFFIGWIGGVIAWGAIFIQDNYTQTLSDGFMRASMIALGGAIYGVYYGRKRQKNRANEDAFR